MVLLLVNSIYGIGHNEGLVGEAIKKFGRDKFFLATKHAIIRNADGSLTINSSPEYVILAGSDWRAASRLALLNPNSVSPLPVVFLPRQIHQEGMRCFPQKTWCLDN